MNKKLAEIIKIYATKSDKDLERYLSGMTKNNLIEVLVSLITMYINDKNSSTLREFITVTVAGYQHTEGKIGYDGYKQSVHGESLMCEAKPKNVISGWKWKLNGGGNFTDYTHERLERDIKENLHMLVSGFVDGKLIYILEFPFKCNSFVSKLKKQLDRRFPDGDIPGQFLRSANFNYKDYIGCKDLKVVYHLPEADLVKYKDNIVKGFYKFLMEVASND